MVKVYHQKIGLPRQYDFTAEPSKGFGLGQLIRWVWLHSKSEAKWLVVAMLSSSVVSALSSISLLYASRFINEVSAGRDSQRLLKIAGLVLAIFLGIALFRLVSSTLTALATTNIKRNLEKSCFEQLSSLPFEYLQQQRSGRIMAAIMSETPMVVRIVGTTLRSFVRAPLTILLVIVVLFVSSPKVAAVAVCVIPLLFIGVSYFSSWAKSKTEKSFRTISQMYTKINEHMAGLRVIKTMGLMNTCAEKMKEMSEEIAKTSRQSAVASALQQTLQEILSLIFLIFFLWWLALQVMNGKMEIGQALLVPAGLVYIRREALFVSKGYVSLRKTEGAAERLHELLQIEAKPSGSKVIEGPLRKITLEDVGFSYPNGKEVLNGVNLELTPGEFVVLIGESGAGKSTLCDLCLRLLTPTRGKIYYNDIPLSEIGERHLRQISALVEQEPFLFDDTIRNNLAVAGNDLTEEQMWEALEMARLVEFVRNVPGGLDARVGEGGTKLSVGQKQRLVLARSLIRKPQFLILDEFTSSLDLQNEAAVIDTIIESTSDRITLCASHRPSLIKKAARVYMISGATVERLEDAGGLSGGSDG